VLLALVFSGFLVRGTQATTGVPGLTQSIMGSSRGRRTVRDTFMDSA